MPDRVPLQVDESSRTRELYECPVHGLVEVTQEGIDYINEGRTEVKIQVCPISLGQDEVCYTTLDGPITVEVR